MKKMLLTMSALGALCSAALTGCSVHINNDTMHQTADVEVSELGAAEIEDSAQPVEGTHDSERDVHTETARTTVVTEHSALPVVQTTVVSDQAQAAQLTAAQTMSCPAGAKPACPETQKPVRSVRLRQRTTRIMRR